MISKIEAIVINTYDISDYDQIITVFSKQKGKLAFYAPGVRKILSKNKYSVQLFSNSEFELFLSYHDEKLSKLKTSNLINNFINIANDYSQYLFATVIIELIDQAFETRKSNVLSFTLLKSSLLVLAESENKKNVLAFFLYKALHWFGHQWNLNCCKRCKNHNNITTFGLIEIGFICRNCVTKKDVIFDTEFLKLMSQWQNVSVEKYFSLHLSEKNQFASLFLKLLIEYYLDTIGLFSSAINEMVKNGLI